MKWGNKAKRSLIMVGVARLPRHFESARAGAALYLGMVIDVSTWQLLTFFIHIFEIKKNFISNSKLYIKWTKNWLMNAFITISVYVQMWGGREKCISVVGLKSNITTLWPEDELSTPSVGPTRCGLVGTIKFFFCTFMVFFLIFFFLF